MESTDYNSVDGSWDAIREKELTGYRNQAYIVLQNALTPTEVEEILSALGEVIQNENFVKNADETCRKQSQGEINLAFGGCHPVLQFENFAKEITDQKERYQLKNVRKLMGFHKHHPRLQALAEDPGLQRVIKCMLMEAGCTKEQVNELEVFQSLALLKPKGGREKPWHQDNSYFNIDGEEVKCAGVWIALSEVTIENGAMHCLPGPLNELKPIPHFSRRDWQICDSETDSKPCVAVPLHPGGALLFSTMLPHGTPTNLGEMQRLAIQFHFEPKGSRRTSDAQRLAEYGGEGVGVSC